MSVLEDLGRAVAWVSEHEEVIEKIGKPLVELVAEALDGGVTHDTLVRSIKAEMVAASRARMKEELDP